MQRPVTSHAREWHDIEGERHRWLVMQLLAYPHGGNSLNAIDTFSNVALLQFAFEQAGEMVQPYLHWVTEQPQYNAVVPDAIRDKLAHSRQSVRIRNLRWAAELRAIRELFASAGVPALFAKGAILQRTVYPDIATRPMSDIDLYVRGNDMGQVYDLLPKAGFTPYAPRDSQTPIIGEQINEEAKFFKRLGTNFLLLEVHTQLEMNFGRQIPRWDRICEIVGTDGLQLPTVDLDTSLRHICFHLARHGFEHGLMWLLDIKCFVDKHGDAIPWRQVFVNCDYRARPLLACTLTAAAEWLGCKVPQFVLNIAYDHGWIEARPLIWAQVWRPEQTAPALPVVAAMLSGNPRKFWEYIIDRFRSWTAPVPGEPHSGGLLMAKRLRTSLNLLAGYARAGTFNYASLKAARESETRMTQLRAILWERPQR